jgi:hypothetical protein
VLGGPALTHDWTSAGGLLNADTIEPVVKLMSP